MLLLSMLTAAVYAQNDEEEVDRTPKIGGTIRSKYEYQTEEGEGRFEVRTARVSVSGNVTKEVSYKAEIDLCDEGKIKMLDGLHTHQALEHPAVFHRSGACALYH